MAYEQYWQPKWLRRTPMGLQSQQRTSSQQAVGFRVPYPADKDKPILQRRDAEDDRSRPESHAHEQGRQGNGDDPDGYNRLPKELIRVRHRAGTCGCGHRDGWRLALCSPLLRVLGIWGILKDWPSHWGTASAQHQHPSVAAHKKKRWTRCRLDFTLTTTMTAAIPGPNIYRRHLQRKNKCIGSV